MGVGAGTGLLSGMRMALAVNGRGCERMGYVGLCKSSWNQMV